MEGGWLWISCNKHDGKSTLISPRTDVVFSESALLDSSMVTEVVKLEDIFWGIRQGRCLQMWETIASAQSLLDSHKWWQTQTLTVTKALTAPEDACAAGMDAVKHASGAADDDMPADFCACPHIYAGDTGCACPYQFNNAVYN